MNTVNAGVRGSSPRRRANYGYDDSAFLLQEVAGRFNSYGIHHFVPIAQLAEHRIPNSRVGGSSPSWFAKYIYTGAFMNNEGWDGISNEGSGYAEKIPRI